MYSYFKTIDEHVLAVVYEYEEKQLLKFKSEFDSLCLSISKLHGWNYVISIHRWTDIADKCVNKPFDGYTATLQIDFIDNIGNVVEFDENICSFFENITFITFVPIRRKYRVFQNEELASIRTEMNQFIRSFENS
jgi:hypothetical protein